MRIELQLDRTTGAIRRTRIYSRPARKAALWLRAIGYDHSRRVRRLVRGLTLSALVVACTRMPAMESWSLPDLSQTDKQEHLAGGFVVAAATDAVLAAYRVNDGWSWWKRDLADIGAATLVGVAKEVRDDHRGRKYDTCDPADAIATTLGGAAYVLLSHTWRF